MQLQIDQLLAVLGGLSASTGTGGSSGGASADDVIAAAVTVGSAAGDIGVNSATFVDITGMSVNITAATGDKLLVLFAFHQNSVGTFISTTLNIEGADVLGTSAIATVGSTPGDSSTGSTQWLHTVAAGGTITIKARGRTGGSSTIANTTTYGVPRLLVLNLKQ